MKKNVILTVVALMAFAVGASAQGFGVNAGVNFFNQTIKGGGIELDTKMLTGFHVGVDYEIAVAPDFFFAPGLQFSTKGSKLEEDFLGLGTEEVKDQLNYLEVPLNLVYKPLLGNGNLIVNFGPYLGYGIGGKSKSDEGDEDIEFGSGDDEIKPFDMGANIGFGYMLGNGLSFKLNAQLGLINLSNVDDVTVKNNGFGLSVGYRF